MAFHPYLFFGGSCREAFTAYQQIFGGELTLITAADMPPEEAPPDTSPDLIMHAALMIGDALLMGSDDPTTDGLGPVKGMQVNCTFGDAGVTSKAFDALADGGTITLPIGPTSWSPLFGMCVDRFGTPWMVSVNDPPTP
jgi:PhnB protein